MNKVRFGEWLRRFAILTVILIALSLATALRAKTLSATNSPAGAEAEINGVVGTTPFQTNYPGWIFSQDPYGVQHTSGTPDGFASVEERVRGAADDNYREAAVR
jgi:hypothetical protein